MPADGLLAYDRDQGEMFLPVNRVQFQPKMVNFASNINLYQHYYLYVYNVLMPIKQLLASLDKSSRLPYICFARNPTEPLCSVAYGRKHQSYAHPHDAR